MSLLLRTQGMGIAALALGISVFLSRILGLIRDKILSFYFGTSIEADIYFTAFVIPDFLSYLLAGGYFSITLVPLLSSLFLQNKEDGWRFFSTVVCWAFVAISLLSVTASIFADQLVHIIAPGFSSEASHRLVTFLRIVLPSQIFFLPGSCFTAILYYRKQFAIPALTPLIYNSSIILSGLFSIVFFPEKGMEGFCWGVTIGAFLGGFLLPFWGTYKGEDFTFTLCFYHPAMRRLLLLALPLMLGQSIASLDEQFVRIFGSLANEGSISLLSYARRVMHVPVGVIAQAAGLASFPFLAALVAQKDWQGVNQSLQKTTKAAVLIALPVSAWMMLESTPIMRLIFQQGSFSLQNAYDSGMLLLIMLSSVLFWTLQQILGRAFYSYQDTLTPTLAGTAATLLSLPVYWYATIHYGAMGIAIVGVVAVGLYTAILFGCWGRKFGFTAFSGVSREAMLSISICAISATISYYIGRWFNPTLAPYGLWGVACHLCLSWTTFCISYIGLCLTMQPQLCLPFMVFLRKLIKRFA